MRKLYYISCLFILFSCTPPKKTNWNLNLDRNSKQPYGCYIAYQSLKDFFYTTNISATRKPLNDIKQINKDGTQSNVAIIVVNNFDIDSIELEAIQKYVSGYNHLLICANHFDDSLLNYLKLKKENSFFFNYVNTDTIRQTHYSINFNNVYYDYIYKGYLKTTPFKLDSIHLEKTSHWAYCDSSQNPSVVTFYDNGSLTLCSAPLLFTNHFILQNNNRECFEKLLSNFNEYPNKIIWSSGMNNIAGNSDNQSELSKLLKIPAIRYAFLIILGLLFIYALLESRRRQRIIPIIPKNVNTTLEFTETIGMLYYNKQDNANLVQKMINHYLEHVRSSYDLKTNNLNDTFIHKLSIKINKPLEEVKAFMGFVQYIREGNKVTDKDVLHLHQQIKKYS